METDIIQQAIAGYTRKYKAYREQNEHLQQQKDNSRQKINWHERRIARLSAKQQALFRPYWPDEVLPPVLEELAHLTPEVKWELNELRIFGLRCVCPVYGKTKEGHTVNLSFTFEDNSLYYDTGEVISRFEPGTLGYINGMNNISAPVENIGILVAKVKEQIAGYTPETVIANP